LTVFLGNGHKWHAKVNKHHILGSAALLEHINKRRRAILVKSDT
jgi:hypothetical protein